MTSKQRAYLRSIANSIEPIFQIGKAGISDNFVKQINDALEARELIKISVLSNAPDDIVSIGTSLAELTDSEFVQHVGSKITLFRQRKENSKINLKNV